MRRDSLPRAGVSLARLSGHAGCHGASHQPLQSLLPEAAPGQPGRPTLGQRDRGRLWGQAHLRLPAGSRGARLTLTTDNGTQFASAQFVQTLAELGITHRRTAYHHPEGNSYIERFHRSLGARGHCQANSFHAPPGVSALGENSAAREIPLESHLLAHFNHTFQTPP